MPPLAPGLTPAPDWVAGGTPKPLRSRLISALGRDAVLDRATDLIRFASDASPYRQIPRAVVEPRDVAAVEAVMALAREEGLPVVFRAAGTSLMGQSQTDGILVRLGPAWRGIEVLDDGARIRSGSGAILGHLNRLLAVHGRKVGPDPASTDFAMVGGIVANNSGGMRCGIERDSYETVSSLTFTLPSGTTIDTASPDASARFAAEEPELHAGLAEIRDRIRADEELSSRIRRKFEIKNTVGYRLCAFLDDDEPLEIFRRLLVGSEGTLAFLSEVIFETVPRPERTSVTWAHFPSTDAAVAAVRELVDAGATAVELMTASTLEVAASSIPGAPPEWTDLPDGSAALLIELSGSEPDDLAQGEFAADAVLEGCELLWPVEWARDPERIALNWHVRHSLHGLAGDLRPPGTALIVEDVCVRPERMAECAGALQKLLAHHGFLTLLAGHASVGNLHFFLTPDFSEPSEIDRYEAFMAELVELICDRFDGSLKAEHGTGRNMAPFVEWEWGREATEIMWRIKQLADPDRILAPGVVLSRDPDAHLADLKATPEIEDSVTGCVECGFCEPVCPSRDLTTTPRQRIVLRREIARQPAGSPLARVLTDEFAYDGIDTCAADGVCALSCPLGINTGELIKGMRADGHSAREQRAAVTVAERWRSVERAARAGLGVGGAVARLAGPRAPRALSELPRVAFGAESVPAWVRPMPPAADANLPGTSRDGAAAVYLPACINRIFGREPNGDGDAAASLPAAMAALSSRAGMPVWIPADVAGTCCGTPFSSKGYTDAHAAMVERTINQLWEWSGGGELPIVVDATSCTQGLIDAGEVLSGEAARRHAALDLFDSIAWIERHLLDRLDPRPIEGTAVVHPTCSSRHLGLDSALERIAAAVASEVVVPPSASCCGFAGDRGFLHPELTAAALAEETREVDRAAGDLHLCANRTCEIGLARATGERWESFVYALEQATRPG